MGRKTIDQLWDEATWNTIQEIICRVHPKGAEAIDLFRAYWEQNKDKWLGPHRAAGAWLYTELNKKDAE